MYAQLDLEVRCKRPKKKREDHLIFINFGVKKFTLKNTPKKKFLEVDVQQGNFKILRLFPQVLILFLVEKWIPPTRSETADIGQKNRRNFRDLIIMQS
jgi:hypothetical protein